MKILKIEFKSAKKFPKDGRSIKKNSESWACVPENTLHYKHVSNVLHVLCGLRPVSSVRGANTNLAAEYQASAELLECAKNAKILISSVGEQLNGKGDLVPFTEFLGGGHYWTDNAQLLPSVRSCYISEAVPVVTSGKAKKEIPNAFTVGDISWDCIRYDLGDTFNEFVDALREVVGVGLDLRRFNVVSAFDALYQHTHSDKYAGSLLDAFFKKHWDDPIKQAETNEENTNKNKVIKASNKSIKDKKQHQPLLPLVAVGAKIPKRYINIIRHGRVFGQFFHNGSNFATNMGYYWARISTNSPMEITTVSGTIFACISDEMCGMIEKYGKASATILDGGYAQITGCYEDYEINYNDETANAAAAFCEGF